MLMGDSGNIVDSVYAYRGNCSWAVDRALGAVLLLSLDDGRCPVQCRIRIRVRKMTCRASLLPLSQYLDGGTCYHVLPQAPAEVPKIW